MGTRYMVHWDEHATHLANRLGYLLEHQLFVDVTLMCNTHTLKVHRSVLAACSPYFEEVLQRQLGNHPLIVLKDMKFSVLKSMIEFMYCGETSVTEENLNPLMEAAKFFEVKGLSSMSKDALGDKNPATTQNSVNTTAVTSTTSNTDFTNVSSYKGRGRRPGVSRGGRRSATVPTQVLSSGNSPTAIISTSPVPQTESAQILLSLSGNNSSQTLQTSSRNIRISPNNCMNKIIRNNSSFIEGQNGTALQNGTLVSSELKSLRNQNFEPRRRGRRKQSNISFGRGRDKDLDCKLAVENLKKEMEDIQQKDSVLFKHFDSNVNFLNNNVLNSSDKSPLLASLLSKAEQLNNKEKVKEENQTEELNQKEALNSEQEMVLCQFDGETNNVGKYLDVLKEAGLPTDVPVLIDSGDGNYVTLTEDFLTNFLGNNKDFQFQVTEATLQQGEVGEGVVLQDGSIMMTAKDGKSDSGGTILSVDNDFRVVKDNKREIKTKCTTPSKQFVVKEMQASKSDEEDYATLHNKPTSKEVKQKSKMSLQELINEAVLESLKSGAASDNEVDPDAVILFEVTDNAKVAKYVVSSKEVNALKALNEQIVQKKKLVNGNKEEMKCNNISTVGIAGSKTKIAEVKLTVGKNYKKSIISQVLECAQNLEGKNVKLDYPEEQEKLEPIIPETEHHSQIVSLEFIDGNGEKIEGYQVDGPKLSNKQITDLTEQTNDDHNSRDQDVMGLLDMVCEEAAQSVMESQVLDNVTAVNLENETLNECVEIDDSVNQNEDSRAGAEYLNVEIKDVHSCLNTEHLVLEQVQNNSVNSNHCQQETPEISLDSQELAVEQALEAMMGDSESRSNTITQDFKEVNNEHDSQENNNLQLVLTQENELSEKQMLEETNDFQFVYTEEKLCERSGSEVIIMEPVDDMLLSTLNNTDKSSLVMGDVIAEECIETSVISPTKDVPFAVGLLPLRTALEKIQLKTEHQPRKTRSGIVSLRHECQPTKRRPSMDNQNEMPEKKIKTNDGHENVIEQIVAVEEECVVTTT